MSDGSQTGPTDVMVGKAGAIHLLVSGSTENGGLDWLLSPSLEDLRSVLVKRTRVTMKTAPTVLLALPPMGPVTSRMRLEALLAAVQDLAELQRRDAFAVVLVPQAGDRIAAVDSLCSLTVARGLGVASDRARAKSSRPTLSIPTETEQLAFTASTGRALSVLTGSSLTSSGLSSSGGGMAAAIGIVGGAVGAAAAPGLLALAGPVGLIGAAAAFATRGWQTAKREKDLEKELQRREKSWLDRVRAVEREQKERHQSQVEALQARIDDLQATVAEQALALTELRSRAGADHRAANLAQPVAFAISLAADPVEPLQQRENLKYAWRLLIRYIGALMLADLQHSGPCTPKAAPDIQKALREKSGDGRWLHICRGIADLTERDGSFFAVPATAWKRGKKGYGSLLNPLDRLRDARNDEVHGTRIPSPAAAATWLSEVQTAWSAVLQEAQPYTGCHLFIVDSIVDHAEGGATVYQVRWLVGDLLFPRAERCTWPVRLKRGCLYLLRLGLDRPSSDSDILDVSTFLRWEHSGILDRPETYGVVGMRSDTLEFGAFRFQHEKALEGAVPEWLAAK